MAVTNLDKAKVSIVTQHAFFASILMKRPLIYDDPGVDTMAVDQRGQMYANREWIATKTVQELVFLLCHEAMHVVGQHPARLHGRDKDDWNIASDAWVNDVLIDQKIGDFVEGGVRMPGSKDKVVDAIYNEIHQDREEQDGSGGVKRIGGAGNDLIERGAPVSPDERSRLDAELRVEVAQAAQAAKMQGQLHGMLAKLVADLIDPGTPWYEILERYMVDFTKGDYSWARPNRRYVDNYLPSVGNVAQMGELVVQVDVSGSISKRELDYYNGHMARIIELCKPERVHVLYVDTHVCKHETFEEGEEFKLEFYSGGGTDMEAGFEYLDKQGIQPEVIVVLTDGYTSFRPTSPASAPVVWCISTDVVAPYGETVPFTMEAWNESKSQ